MIHTDGPVSHSTKRFRVAGRILALLVGSGLVLPAAAAADEKIRALGFLAGLPAAGLALPTSTTVEATIEVPVERDGSNLSLPINFTSQTKSKLSRATVKDGEFVEVRLTLQGGKLVVKKIREVKVLQINGKMRNLTGGTLNFPLSTTETVTFQLGDLQDLLLNFAVTADTETQLDAATAFDSLLVSLNVVAGQLTAVEIEQDDANEED